jgi:hypothetical protein
MVIHGNFDWGEVKITISMNRIWRVLLVFAMCVSVLCHAVSVNAAPADENAKPYLLADKIIIRSLNEIGSGDPIQLQWTFRWRNAEQLEATVTPGSMHPTGYTLGNYQLNVNGSLSGKGEKISGAPILGALVQNPNQLWRYSADGKHRELLSTIDDLYSLSQLANEDRFFLATRFGQYCECDANYEALYALYDQLENKLIRYPVPLKTNYMGKGDFTADQRGFFYEQPGSGIQIPQSDTAKRIHVDGFKHDRPTHL